MTETCDLEEEEVASATRIPHLIVQVHTTVAPVQDVEVTADIQADLAQHHLVPEEQIVDSGYVDADLLVSRKPSLWHPLARSRPVRQQRAAPKPARASMWRISSSIGTPSKRPVHRASRAVGGVGHGIASKWCLLPRCAPSVRCVANVRSRLPTGRVLHLRPQAAHEALQARRQEQQTPEFRQEYATRAGIEGTLSQGVRAMGLRRAKYDGLYKTHLQHVSPGRRH
jgi:transposase